jgi:hypothetical protein
MIYHNDKRISKGGKPWLIFVGTHGGLREGTTVTNSRACSDKFRDLVLEGGEDGL